MGMRVSLSLGILFAALSAAERVPWEQPPGQSHYSLYAFFWKKKVAATVLTIGNRTTIQQSARLPVSFAIDLDESYRPAIGYV